MKLQDNIPLNLKDSIIDAEGVNIITYTYLSLMEAVNDFDISSYTLENLSGETRSWTFINVEEKKVFDMVRIEGKWHPSYLLHDEILLADSIEEAINKYGKKDADYAISYAETKYEEITFTSVSPEFEEL